MAGFRLITPPACEPLTLAEAKLHVKVDFTDDDTYITGLITAARQWAESFCGRAFVTQQWQLTLDNFPNAFGYGTVMGNPGFGMGYAGWIPGYGRGGSVNIWFANGVVELPFPRLQSVDLITYIDRTSTLQTLDPTLYQVDTDSEPGRIAPITTQIWPFTQLSLLAPSLDAIKVKFTCGYGAQGLLNGAQDVSASTLTLVSTTMLPAAGSVKITTPIQGTQVITYTGNTGTTLTGCKGAQQETAADQTPVVWDDTPMTIKQALKLVIGHWYQNREAVITGPRAAAVEVPFTAETLLWRDRMYKYV